MTEPLPSASRWSPRSPAASLSSTRSPSRRAARDGLKRLAQSSPVSGSSTTWNTAFSIASPGTTSAAASLRDGRRAANLAAEAPPLHPHAPAALSSVAGEERGDERRLLLRRGRQLRDLGVGHEARRLVEEAVQGLCGAAQTSVRT